MTDFSDPYIVFDKYHSLRFFYEVKTQELLNNTYKFDDLDARNGHYQTSDSEYLLQILSNSNRAQTIGLDGSHSSTSNIALEGILGLGTVYFLSKTYKGLDSKSLHIFLIFLIFRQNFNKNMIFVISVTSSIRPDIKVLN